MPLFPASSTTSPVVADSPEERRRQPRFPSLALSARIRLKGQLNRLNVEVLDFNRHGIAVQVDRPLPKDQLVFMSLDDGNNTLDRVIGVVHNCLSQASGFRCGIRFRTQSGLQFDQDLVEAELARLEATLSALAEPDQG